MTTRFSKITLDDLTWTGKDLNRPECVLATKAGDLYCSDARGGVSHIRPDGTQALYTGKWEGRSPLLPNGIAVRRNGNFLIANLGEDGGVFELTRTGELRPVLTEVAGITLPSTNFVCEDAFGRTWVTVSTLQTPRAKAYNSKFADGFIVLIDARGARIAADGIGYTNEVALSADGKFLYVNETFARRLARFRLAADGTLSERETVCSFGKGTFPDGLTFDAEGCAWITSVVSNRVIRVKPDGSQTIVLEDVDERHIDWCEDAYLSATMSSDHLAKSAGRVLKNLSSLAFGGADLRTIYLGSLQRTALATFPAPVRGAEPAHWTW